MDKPSLLTDRQVALLGDIGDPDVQVYGYQIGGRGWAYRRQIGTLMPPETVTAMVQKLLDRGLARRAAEGSGWRYQIELTDAGREYLEALT